MDISGADMLEALVDEQVVRRGDGTSSDPVDSVASSGDPPAM